VQLEAGIADIADRLDAFQETRKLLNKKANKEGVPELRSGSELFKVKAAIKDSGQPMSLSQMNALVGKEDNVKSRNSMRGSVARYVGTIFVKTAENTYGLVELGHKPTGADLPTAVETINFEEPS